MQTAVVASNEVSVEADVPASQASIFEALEHALLDTDVAVKSPAFGIPLQSAASCMSLSPTLPEDILYAGSQISNFPSAHALNLFFVGSSNQFRK